MADTASPATPGTDPRTRLSIVGTGPGAADHLTPAAVEAVRASTDVVGYGLYLDLLGEVMTGRERHEAPLGEETRRAETALDLAAAGHPTALVSSGDAGVYAMASLLFERLAKRPAAERERLAIDVVPGVSAMQAAAARAGAPLGHDFCAISLSDLLTPWPVIERRVRAAADGDFVVAFYNPASQRRDWQLGEALAILRAARPADTPVVVARNLTRETETVTRTTLAALDPAEVDMLCVVVVGSAQSRVIDDWVYTPRGYATKA